MIDQRQYAYQRGKISIDAVNSAIDILTKQLHEKKPKYVSSAFLDMSKAFDKMDKGKLLCWQKRM